ncbi:MAG: SMC-Scp complex subunit ScpB [Christensenellales bacterium]|jgi:segregation and condensation protein B
MKDNILAAIEAVLFAAGDAVPLEALSSALDTDMLTLQIFLSRYREALDAEDRGLTLRIRDDTVQLATKPAFADVIEKALSPLQKRSLTAAVMEVLTIIAYKQPVTRVEIEEIRGVRCEYALQVLQKLDLIAEVGRKDTIGRPILFGTTPEFLRAFDLPSLSKLPALQFESPEGGMPDEALLTDTAYTEAEP